MKKFVLSSLMIVAVMFCSISIFSGCNNTQYTYAEFQLAYQDYISDYTNEVFDVNGEVAINYKNADMVAVINKTDIDSKMTKFTRLSADPRSNQAMFEPTFKASMKFINNYIKITIGVDIPTNESTKLYNSLEQLRQKTDTFVIEKRKFDTRTNFDVDGGTEKSWINSLLNKFVDLVCQANEFSKQYIEIYNRYNTSATADRTGGRPALGSIEKYYLETLTTLADVYINVYLINIYDEFSRTTSGLEDEAISAQNRSEGVNNALISYENIEAKIKSFESKEGEITDEKEAKAISAYKSALSYNPIFENGYKMTLETYKKVNSESIIGQGFMDNVNDFFACEYANLVLMLQDLSQKIVLAV